jgi:copper homeostasis protein
VNSTGHSHHGHYSTPRREERGASTALIEIEVCVERAEDGIAAVLAGATRVELNTALHLDGLTALASDCRAFKQSCDAPLFAMVRPHPHGFEYTPDEISQAIDSCHELIEAGADGIVFGALRIFGALAIGTSPTADAPPGFRSPANANVMSRHRAAKCIDLQTLARIQAACSGRPLVFHRAFDELHDQTAGLEHLIELGVRRVLTSGGARSAIEGADQLRRLHKQADGRIEILPGAGLSASNALAILNATGCTQIHGSFRATSPQPGRPDLAAIRQTRAAIEALPHL